MKKEEENMNVVLRDIEDNGGFRVPDGYFDRLPEQVMEKIREGEASVPVVSVRRKRVITLVAAAAVALLFVTGYLLLQVKSGAFGNRDAATSVTVYLMSSDVDEQVLYDFMEEENIVPETLPVTRDDDQIIDYLVSEGVNESLVAELY